MIPSIRNILALVALVVLTACAAKPTSKFKTYNGPPVTQIVVEKGDRQMFLLSGRKVLKAYEEARAIALANPAEVRKALVEATAKAGAAPSAASPQMPTGQVSGPPGPTIQPR